MLSLSQRKRPVTVRKKERVIEEIKEVEKKKMKTEEEVEEDKVMYACQLENMKGSLLLQTETYNCNRTMSVTEGKRDC